MRKTYFQTLDESSLVFDVWTFQLFVRVPLLWIFASSGDGGVESLIILFIQVAEFFCTNVAKQRGVVKKQRFEKVP